jgi:hypothetical protein
MTPHTLITDVLEGRNAFIFSVEKYAEQKDTQTGNKNLLSNIPLAPV